MISGEAVEAAAKVMYAQDSQQEDVGEFSLEVYEHDAREILEAAHTCQQGAQQDAVMSDGDYEVPHGPDEPCTCGGCWDCTGAVIGCTCDIDWDKLYEKKRSDW